MTREERIEAHAARLAPELRRRMGRPRRRMSRGPCADCSEPVPSDSRYATRCRTCLELRYYDARCRARRNYRIRQANGGAQ